MKNKIFSRPLHVIITSHSARGGRNHITFNLYHHSVNTTTPTYPHDVTLSHPPMRAHPLSHYSTPFLPLSILQVSRVMELPDRAEVSQPAGHILITIDTVLITIAVFIPYWLCVDSYRYCIDTLLIPRRSSLWKQEPRATRTGPVQSLAPGSGSVSGPENLEPTSCVPVCFQDIQVQVQRASQGRQDGNCSSDWSTCPLSLNGHLQQLSISIDISISPTLSFPGEPNH